MKNVAVVIYISPKIASSYTIWSLEPVRGIPTLVHLLKRLQKGLPVGDFEFLIACHEGVVSNKLKDVLKDLSARLFVSNAPGRLQALVELANAYTDIKTFLIFPEESIFPDCFLTFKMLRRHREERMEGTVESEYPVGLLPEIYETSALRRLMDLELPDDISHNFASVMGKANELFQEDEEAKDLRFKLQWLGEDFLPQGPPLEKLPSRLRIDNVLAKRVAERVLARVGSKTYYDSTEAVFYKEEFLCLENSADFQFDVFASVRSSAIPVLFITPYGAFSGAEQSYAHLITHLDRTRFQPFAVAIKGFFSEMLIAAGIPVEIADFNFASLTPRNTRYFDTLLKKFQIKIVHMDGAAGEAVAMAAHYSGIPIVCHVRSFLGQNAPSILKYAARIITVSESVARDLRRSDLDPQKVQCIYNGQDLAAFRAENYDKAHLREEANIPQDALVIAFIARIAPQKRLEFLLEALPAVVEKFSKSLVLFVGECYPEDISYYERIQKMTDHLTMRDHVRFWGFEKNIFKVHAMSDVLVNCTLNEPFGRSILEALSMSVPVVAPDRGGHLEMLRHNENGLIFDACNPRSLSIELIRLFSNTDIAKRLTKNGLKTVQNFDIVNHVRQVAALYETLL